MAEVTMQETPLPCTALTDGVSPLASDEGGWRPAEEECQSTRPVTEEEDQSRSDDTQKHEPGQLRGRNQADDEWKMLWKKKHRRRPSKKKRRWKPYYKLTWEEKKLLEERESVRASKFRAEMFAKGQPVAPYNTTQFLMEDHDQEEPDLCPPTRRLPATLLPPNANSSKGDSSEEDLEEEEDGTGSDGMGGQDGTEFLQKDFSETYERYHAESLQDMSKQELIREYMELEKCLSRMEEENNRLRLQDLSTTPAGEHQDSRIRELEMELERLKEENKRLVQEKAQSEPVLCEHSSH